MNTYDNVISVYKEKFGTNPNIIGIFWDNPDTEIENIKKAIETNTPYNEYDLLSKEEQEAYDRGELLF